MHRSLLLLILVALAGCNKVSTHEPEIVDPIPVCLEEPFRAELHVDANDPRMVWATNYETGLDVAVRPRPPGRFTFDRGRPTTLLDGSGTVVSFNGEISMTGCLDAGTGVVYFGPSDLPNPNRPPN